MQFFNPFRISLGLLYLLLYLSVFFILIYNVQSFFVFFVLQGTLDFQCLVIVIFSLLCYVIEIEVSNFSQGTFP